MNSRCCVCPGEIVSTGELFGESSPCIHSRFANTKWRKVRDSNPRDAINAYTISSRAPSTNSDNFPHVFDTISLKTAAVKKIFAGERISGAGGRKSHSNFASRFFIGSENLRLYIAEKPAMAREIADCLDNPRRGEGFIATDGGIVTWLVGHILQQARPEIYDARYHFWHVEDLPIIPEKWLLTVAPQYAAQLEIVRNLLNQADEIVHAGDPDREGQLLVDEVLEFLGNTKPVKRILLNALDRTSILRANANLRDNADFFNLKQSALARTHADWLVGINLTRAYTLAARRFGRAEPFQIGRVKTPTLALVVRREREILNFKPVDFFNILAQFATTTGTFVAQWKPNKKILDAEGRLTDEATAQAFAKKFATAPFKAKISSATTTEKTDLPPLPFALSSLQIAAGKKFGYSPRQVLDAAQSLYEKKLTTYPRSDCEYLPTSQLVDATKILANLTDTTDVNLHALAVNANPQIRSRAWNNKKISAHHAIIPTTRKLGGVNITAVEFKIYSLIASNYAVQFHANHVYDETAVAVKYKAETFTARGRIVKINGWREFYAAATVKADDEFDQILPTLKAGDAATYKNSELKKSTTKPPSRFTAATLVKGMKEIHKYVKNPAVQQRLKDVYGLGTESTRATIIDDLIRQDFLSFTGAKKILQPTERAYALIDALPDILTYPDATAVWEEKLHAMAEGNGTLEDFLTEQIGVVSELCRKARDAKFKPAHKTDIICPRCKAGVLVKRRGKFGVFWGCSKFPDCRMTCNDKNGAPDFTGRI